MFGVGGALPCGGPYKLGGRECAWKLVCRDAGELGYGPRPGELGYAYGEPGGGMLNPVPGIGEPTGVPACEPPRDGGGGSEALPANEGDPKLGLCACTNGLGGTTGDP